MFYPWVGYPNSLQFSRHSVVLIIHSKFHIFDVPMTSDSLYYIGKEQVKTIFTCVNSVTNNVKADVSEANSKEQLTRANEVRRLHYALLHAADAALIKSVKYGLLLGTRLTADYVYFYRLIFGACPCCLADKTIIPSYTTFLSPPALMLGHISYPLS